MLLALLKWPISNPTVQKWVFEPRPFGTTFSVVSAKNCSIFKTRFWRKPGAPPKRTKWGGARQHKYFLTFFQVPGFGPFHRIFGTANVKNPFSPQFWACPPATDKCKPHTRRNRGCRWKCHSPEFSWKMPHFQHVAPWRRCIFERPAALTAALPKPTKHCKKKGFPSRGRGAPHFRTHDQEHSRTHWAKKNTPLSNTTAYIYICCGVINWSKFGGFQKLLTGPSLFLFQNNVCQKNTIKRGFSTFLKLKIARVNFQVINWSKLAFFGAPNLDQLITLTWTS